ncbi:unnamed protein product [Rotaria sordida]|uniref:NF-X1-type zinc finger protein NFXL1 n=1 Tax=Rotaria sordida TaxID=392033 RepID=A0A815D595_9BILA|nr:unnamed protein product [Rotaria sordida]CAF3842628.1 unnamed protein product [Rotaria sordida]
MSNTKNAKQKFEEIAKTNQENIRRLLSNEDYQSNLDTVDDRKLIEEVLNKTKNSFNAGSSDDLGRTYQYLIDSLSSNANICLICIDTIEKTDAIWNCSCCYSPFHIVCIQKWIKDGIYQSSSINNNETNTWHCPKCRTEFDQKNIPKRYLCYCQKEIDPQFDPWLIPHSCGQTCGKRLIPECGHICLLLCHPGPCPPCPKQVNVRCYCNQSGPTARRCGFKGWSCGKICSKLLSCQQHRCEQICHSGECLPCQKTSIQTCLCGKTKAIRNCNELNFQCDQPCNRLLNCQIHECKRICHKNECGLCPRQGIRTCPCGKTKYENLSCSEDVPTCGDTCDRKLDCGLHRCLHRCHTGYCESCRQVILKRCRCGLKEKLIPCCQEYLCETKCTRMRSCGKHPCKRKCCDGNCLPCQTICGKTLNCRNHKCLSECHRGQCYPCTHKVDVTCACGQTSITVPCGCEKQTRKPRCNKLCLKPSDCHHREREPHLCHFNECPDCKQQCNLPLKDCSHLCSATCHDSVLVKEEINSSNTPWGIKEKEKLIKKSLPCPPCQVPTTVFCFGQHTSQTFPCSSAQPFCCGQLCNRILKCQNHLCNRACHLVTGVSNQTDAGNECIKCEEMCTKDRPLGCQHSCPLACHSDKCPSCKQRLRMRCHCNTQVIYTDCQTFTNATDEQKEKIKSCEKPCSKKLACGHLCSYSCHSDSCSSVNNCSQLVQVRCGCKRINKELPCYEINTIKNYRLPCDEVCAELKKNRIARTSNPPVVQSIVEESKSSIEIDNSIKNRKNQTNSNVEKTTPTNNRNSSVKKAKPRRFVWTSNKMLFFSISTLTITTATNQLNILTNKTAIHHYIRAFVDYLDNGIDFSELSQIR